MGVGGFYHHASYIKFQSTLLLVQGNAREIILRSNSICLVKKRYIFSLIQFYHLNIISIQDLFVDLFLNILLIHNIKQSRFELTWYKVFTTRQVSFLRVKVQNETLAFILQANWELRLKDFMSNQVTTSTLAPLQEYIKISFHALLSHILPHV